LYKLLPQLATKLRLNTNPEKSAIANTGEKPERAISGPKKYLQRVVISASTKVNMAVLREKDICKIIFWF